MNKEEMKDMLEVLLNGFYKSGELFIYISEFENEEDTAKRFYVGGENLFISREYCEEHDTEHINVFIQLKSDEWENWEEFHKDTPEDKKTHKQFNYHS